ncbi:MAG: universal stress protein [Nitrospiraceae bacterium]
MRILIAVDGSDQSYEAARALRELSPPEEVILLYVLDVPKPAYPGIDPEISADIYATVEQQMRNEGERMLDQAASLLTLGSIPLRRHLVVGKPADLILSVAEKKHVDLIVMGSRGYGPLKELVLGSVSHRVVSQAHRPVLTVKHPLPRLRHALLAVQGQEDAQAAIQFAAGKPFREAVDLTVLTAVSFAPPPWPAGGSVAEAMKEEVLQKALSFVDEVAAQLPTDMYRAKATAIIGTPASVILNEATKSNSDLILMGSRGRKGITRRVLGSQCHAVLHQAPCPVLIFPWPGA